MSTFPSFLKLNNIPVWVGITFEFSIHPLMDTWVASTHWLLQVTLLWTWVDKYLCEFLLSVLDVYLEVELLNRTVILPQFSKSCPAMSHCSCTILHHYMQCTGFQFLHIFSLDFSRKVRPATPICESELTNGVYLFINIYSFIWLCQVLVVAYGI